MKIQKDNTLTRGCRTGSINIDEVSDGGELSIGIRAGSLFRTGSELTKREKIPRPKGIPLATTDAQWPPPGALPRHTCKRQQPLFLPNRTCKAQTHQNKPIGKKKLPTRAEYSRC